MQVFKFGGASVKDAEGVKNLASVVNLHAKNQLLIVISAMGKTTNALENLVKSYFNHNEDTHQIFESIKEYHNQIIKDLFIDNAQNVLDDVSNTFVEIDWILEEEPHEDFDFVYDQIVSIGEVVSTKIVSAYLNSTGLKNKWIDA